MEMKQNKYFTLFQVYCGNTKYGEDLYVTGSIPSLGNWNPRDALKLYTSEQTFPMWKTKIHEVICPGELFEYKYIIKTDKDVRWETFSGNRHLALEEIEKLAKHQIEFTVEIHDEK